MPVSCSLSLSPSPSLNSRTRTHAHRAAPSSPNRYLERYREVLKVSRSSRPGSSRAGAVGPARLRQPESAHSPPGSVLPHAAIAAAAAENFLRVAFAGIVLPHPPACL